MNSAASPEDLHKLFEQALNSGDLDALVALYAFDGFLMARSGPARGISAIRKALTEYVAMEPTIQLTTRRVVQAGNTALLVADWRFPRNRHTPTLYRQQRFRRINSPIHPAALLRCLPAAAC